jgi:hypothetical protein
VEEVHVAFVLAYGQFPTFIQAKSFLKPFRSNVVQPAKLEQSYSDYFGPSAHLKFLKKHDEQSEADSELLFTRMLEAENNPTIPARPSRPNHHSSVKQ